MNIHRQSPDPFLQRLRWVVIALLLIVVVWNLVPWVESLFISMTAEPRSVTARGELAQSERNSIDVFEQSSPSVVFITTSQRVMDFWTRNIFNVERGTGSGVLWDEHGHLVTNNHVIDQAAEASVRLIDGRSYKAVLIGSSPAHDLAVLRINVPFNLPPAVPIGTSHDLKVGQKVLAIGNPFGLDHTLTTGVVSALDRSIEAEKGGTIDHLIQTDAAINPGNSGGPLLDSAGRLIGINTAIFSPSGAYAGIGFAVPVDTVNRVVPQLIAKGQYIRPTLGINVDQDINQQVMQQLDLEGVLVLRVEPNSAAERAGLQATSVDQNGDIIPGDVILSIDGEEIEDVNDLLSVLDQYNIGEPVKLEIWRLGQQLDIEVILQ